MENTRNSKRVINPGGGTVNTLRKLPDRSDPSDPSLLPFTDRSAPPPTLVRVLLSIMTSPVVLNFEVRPPIIPVYLEYVYHETSGIPGLE